MLCFLFLQRLHSNTDVQAVGAIRTFYLRNSVNIIKLVLTGPELPVIQLILINMSILSKVD